MQTEEKKQRTLTVWMWGVVGFAVFVVILLFLVWSFEQKNGISPKTGELVMPPAGTSTLAAAVSVMQPSALALLTVALA